MVARDRLSVELAQAFGTESAGLAASGALALMAFVQTHVPYGGEVLVPAWVSSTVLSAIILGGGIPVLTDITPNFQQSIRSASRMRRARTALALYCPYGGFAPDVAEWVDWARSERLSLLLDLAQSPDPALWAYAPRTAGAITSFRPRKALGAAGGGAFMGRDRAVALVGGFLTGGKDAHGRKVSIGVDAPMTNGQAQQALLRLRTCLHADERMRVTSRRWLASTPGALPGWADTAFALSRAATVGTRGTAFNPEATFRSRGWRREVLRRYGRRARADTVRLGRMYPKLRFQLLT